jgi:hypothetical protein
MYISAGVECHMITKEMAKGANIKSDQFLKLAGQTVRKTSRESA